MSEVEKARKPGTPLSPKELAQRKAAALISAQKRRKKDVQLLRRGARRQRSDFRESGMGLTDAEWAAYDRLDERSRSAIIRSETLPRKSTPSARQGKVTRTVDRMGGRSVKNEEGFLLLQSNPGGDWTAGNPRNSRSASAPTAFDAMEQAGFPKETALDMFRDMPDSDAAGPVGVPSVVTSEPPRPGYPTGRSDYKPGQARVGQRTPQSHPEEFSDEDLVAEAKYLLAMNRKLGENTLRSLATLKLINEVNRRHKNPDNPIARSELSREDGSIQHYVEEAGMTRPKGKGLFGR
jgi:hypothetical protein